MCSVGNAFTRGQFTSAYGYQGCLKLEIVAYSCLLIKNYTNRHHLKMQLIINISGEQFTI